MILVAKDNVFVSGELGQAVTLDLPLAFLRLACNLTPHDFGFLDSSYEMVDLSSEEKAEFEAGLQACVEAANSVA